jgi:hypothetical protein
MLKYLMDMTTVLRRMAKLMITSKARVDYSQKKGSQHLFGRIYCLISVFLIMNLCISIHAL